MTKEEKPLGLFERLVAEGVSQSFIWDFAKTLEVIAKMIQEDGMDMLTREGHVFGPTGKSDSDDPT